MNQPLPSIAACLKAWADLRPSTGERRVASVARALRVHWNTAEDWLTGRTVPRDRDLAYLAPLIGVPLVELQAMAEADRTARRPAKAAPVQIDTPEQTRAWIALQDPTPIAEGA
jgi:hypothetical protein